MGSRRGSWFLRASSTRLGDSYTGGSSGSDEGRRTDAIIDGHHTAVAEANRRSAGGAEHDRLNSSVAPTPPRGKPSSGEPRASVASRNWGSYGGQRVASGLVGESGPRRTYLFGGPHGLGIWVCIVAGHGGRVGERGQEMQKIAQKGAILQRRWVAGNGGGTRRWMDRPVAGVVGAGWMGGRGRHGWGDGVTWPLVGRPRGPTGHIYYEAALAIQHCLIYRRNPARLPAVSNKLIGYGIGGIGNSHL